MCEKFYGVSYYQPHVYRVLRKGNTSGGGSKVAEKEFDEQILGWVYTRALMSYYDMLPDGRVKKALTEKDKLLPEEMVNISWKIKNFLDAHGPFSPLAIGLMNCIIEMDEMGITDTAFYFKLKEHLDINPAKNFKDYIRKLIEFEKELKE